jgi:hypothetical protein
MLRGMSVDLKLVRRQFVGEGLCERNGERSTSCRRGLPGSYVSVVLTNRCDYVSSKESLVKGSHFSNFSNE